MAAKTMKMIGWTTVSFIIHVSHLRFSFLDIGANLTGTYCIHLYATRNMLIPLNILQIQCSKVYIMENKHIKVSLIPSYKYKIFWL